MAQRGPASPDAAVNPSGRLYAPQTRSDVLLDQVGTYGRNPEDVALAGHKKLEKSVLAGRSSSGGYQHL